MESDSVTHAAEELVAALSAGDARRIQALCVPEFWERAGEDEYAERLPVDGAVELLGILGDRSLILVTPALGRRFALEQAWTGEARPLIADERHFELIDAAALRAEGDQERLQRLAAKLAGQDAGEALVAAFDRGDSAAVRAMVEPERGDLADQEAERAAGATRADLVGSVGPRTLVRVWSGDSDVTLEYLWRRNGNDLRIAFVRQFSRDG